MLGKTIYPIVQYGDREATGTADETVWLPKYVPVKVIKVEPDEQSEPVKLTVEYPNRKRLTDNYIFSGINSRKGPACERSKLLKNFSLTNPRDKAKGSNDVVWQAIQAGIPVKGMTMVECQLATGKPTRQSESMDKDQYNEFYYEWHHDKAWRIGFKNGVLNKYATYE